MVDLLRTFDRVVHTKLIYKLSNFGISGDLLQWIEAFLTNRQQCVVVVEHCFSTFIPVLSGVAQGSVIGPLLFMGALRKAETQNAEIQNAEKSKGRKFKTPKIERPKNQNAEIRKVKKV